LVTFTVNVFGIILVMLIISLTTEFNSLSTSLVSYSKLDTGHYFDLLKEAYQIELSGEKQTHDVDNRKVEWDKLKEAREIDSQIIVATNRFLPVLDLVKGAPNWCVLFFQFYGGDFCDASSTGKPELPGGNPESDATDAKLPTEPNVHSPDSATLGIRPRSNRPTSKVEPQAKGLSPPENISTRANGTPVVINRGDLERFASEQGFTTTSWNQINTIYLIKGTAPNIIYFLSSSILPLLYGLLGATVYLMRSYYGEGENAGNNIPVDAGFGRALLRIGLGGVAGLAIGWFSTPNAANNTAFSTTPFALAFLAGFSIELLFSILDRVLAAVSPAPRAPVPTKVVETTTTANGNQPTP
jgi:hypothetical protein